MNTKFFLAFVGVVMMTMTGCVGQRAFTQMARTGDTVTLSLGGSPRHEVNGFVNKNNMQVKIKDSAGDTYDVNLRYLFKLYSDPSNRYNYNATYDKRIDSYISRYYMNPGEGLWVAVVDLIDPITSVPLPLAEGTANFLVTTPDLNESIQLYGGIPDTDGHLSRIPIVILPGTGAPHPFNDFADPVDLEPLPQMKISFDNSALTLPYPDENIRIGAIEFRLDYDMAYFDDTKYPPMILDNINDSRINVFHRRKAAEGYYKIMIMPQSLGAGVLANDDPDNLYLKPQIDEIKVFIVWAPTFINGAIDSANYDQVFTISGYKVVDRDGVPLEDGGGSPLITLETEPHMD